MSHNESRSILKHFVVTMRSRMKEMMGILVETQLVSSPRYSHTHITSCPHISDEKQNSSGPTATVQPWSHN